MLAHTRAVIKARYRHIASLRGAAEFGGYRGTADIAQTCRWPFR
jgi:hypothetical protein